MIRTILDIDGMACGMCEAHVNDTVRKACPDISKVSSSHSKGETVIISEGPLDEEALKAAINATGYKVEGVRSEPYEKKKFSLFGR